MSARDDIAYAPSSALDDCIPAALDRGIRTSPVTALMKGVWNGLEREGRKVLTATTDGIVATRGDDRFEVVFDQERDLISVDVVSGGTKTCDCWYGVLGQRDRVAPSLVPVVISESVARIMAVVATGGAA